MNDWNKREKSAQKKGRKKNKRKHEKAHIENGEKI